MANAETTSDDKAQWKETSGFAADTTVVQIVVKEDKVETWDQEAEEQGFDNRSDYLRTLIGEARTNRNHDLPDPQRAEQRIEELQSEIDRLEEELERKRQGPGTVAIDDAAFLEQFLTDEYQPLSEILQQIVETGALDYVIRKRIEDQLYFMAAQDDVEFDRGWGWRLAQEGER